MAEKAVSALLSADGRITMFREAAVTGTGVDVTANQDEISDHETFQLEWDSATKRWYIRTMQDRYWTLESGGGIQASGDKRSSNALFDLVWQGDGSVCFRANNGKLIATKRSGHLYANSDVVDDSSKYFFYLVNRPVSGFFLTVLPGLSGGLAWALPHLYLKEPYRRMRPILVLKCEQGFVGFKAGSSIRLECNRATYETIQVERGEKGVVYFKVGCKIPRIRSIQGRKTLVCRNGKYWHVDGEGVNVDSDAAEGFFLELREPTRICLKSAGPSGCYLSAGKNGAFRLTDTDCATATKWEY
ncbi:Fascin [Homalodisca vitripennis]|nr:Fascin [Homalodisca vitripennis]